MSSRGRISKSRAPARKSVDFSRIRRPFQGKPEGSISFGVVGHYDQNPAFARVENGKVLVEVTLLPQGDEIVAELSQEGQGGGFGFYIPVCIGCRVLVVFPGGEEDPIIIRRLTDREFPFPDDVAGVSTVGEDTGAGTGATGAPQFAFLKTPQGTLLAIESGDDGDVVVRSGANIQLEVDPGQAIHLSGRVHLGASWETAPTGDTTAPSGEVSEGEASEAHEPPAHVPVPVASTPLTAEPGTPDTGILRIRDPIQSDSAVDPVFWAWLVAVHSSLAIVGAAWNSVSSGGGGPLIVPAATPVPIPTPVAAAPTALGSRAKAASLNTCEDG